MRRTCCTRTWSIALSRPFANDRSTSQEMPLSVALASHPHRGFPQKKEPSEYDPESSVRQVNPSSKHVSQKFGKHRCPRVVLRHNNVPSQSECSSHDCLHCAAPLSQAVIVPKLMANPKHKNHTSRKSFFIRLSLCSKRCQAPDLVRRIPRLVVGRANPRGNRKRS